MPKHKWIFNQLGPRPFFPKRAKIGDEKMYMKRVGRNSFFPKIPEIMSRGWEEN